MPNVMLEDNRKILRGFANECVASKREPGLAALCIETLSTSDAHAIEMLGAHIRMVRAIWAQERWNESQSEQTGNG